MDSWLWIIVAIILLLILAGYVLLWFRAFINYPLQTTLRVCISALVLGLASVLAPKPEGQIVALIDFGPVTIIKPAQILIKSPNDSTVLILMGFIFLLAVVCTLRVPAGR